ncbi:MAG: 4Fe-4S binding protein, partial [Methanomassiliicoccales archaeon]|nr:4Fe-4S binding protein [Methanomassiliicoccales archaeon]
SGTMCPRRNHIEAIDDASRMKELSPSAEVTVVSRDVRADGMHELDYRKAQERGIRFVRYDEEPIIEHEGDLRVFVNDLCSDSRLILAADVVVLSGLVSLPSNQKRARIFGVPIEKNGLFRRTQVRLEPASTLREGVFVCGGAASPRLISEMMIEASAAATMALSVVKRRYIEIGGAVAEIDPEKCCVCMTCIRSCPYTAPFVNDESKAEIDIQTCQGCGICVGICPSKAIEMYSYTDNQIDAQSSAIVKGGQDES